MITRATLNAYKTAKRMLKNAELFSLEGAIIYGFTIGMIYSDVPTKEQDYIAKALSKYGRQG